MYPKAAGIARFLGKSAPQNRAFPAFFTLQRLAQVGGNRWSLRDGHKGRLRRPSPVAGLRPALPTGAHRPPDPPALSCDRERKGGKLAGGGAPLAKPLGSPTPPREKVSLRSPLSDGSKTSSSTRMPIQEATTEGRWLSWALIDRSPSNQQSGLPRGVTAGSLVCGYHQYSSEYNAGTCPV